MIYFLPAWYNKENRWFSPAKTWYKTDGKMNFDESISQINFFSEMSIENKIIVLNYRPQLRTFLIEKGIHSEYYNVFDDLLEIDSDYSISNMDFHNLNWPENSTFIYNNFMVMVEKDKKIIAHINFNKDGRLYSVDYIENDELKTKLYFDDRGVFTCSEEYKSSKWIERVYYNQYGEWKIREYRKKDETGNRVHLNDSKKSKYENMEDLIKNTFSKYVEKEIHNEDKIIMAVDNLHNKLLEDVLKDKKYYTSIFSDRNPSKELLNNEYKKILNNSKSIIVDTKDNYNLIEKNIKNKIDIIPPYDTHLSLGISQRFNEIYISVSLDGVEFVMIKKIMEIFYNMMKKNKDIRYEFISYETSFEHYSFVKNMIFNWNYEYLLEKQDPTDLMVNGPIKPESVKEEDGCARFNIIKDEKSLMKILSKARLIVDLSKTPHPYTQIASISVGIPQINSVETYYVSNKDNGYIINEISEVENAINYFIEGLKNWNKSLVYCYKEIKENTGDKLIIKWNNILENQNIDGD